VVAEGIDHRGTNVLAGHQRQDRPGRDGVVAASAVVVLKMLDRKAARYPRCGEALAVARDLWRTVEVAGAEIQLHVGRAGTRAQSVVKCDPRVVVVDPCHRGDLAVAGDVHHLTQSERVPANIAGNEVAVVHADRARHVRLPNAPGNDHVVAHRDARFLSP
jgi:hypothetical protein